MGRKESEEEKNDPIKKGTKERKLKARKK